MPVYTPADQAICDEVRNLGFEVSCREVRTLRELVVIETAASSRGGRSKVAPYRPGTARVVAAVQAAKEDPTYRRKLCRAVLIAWARGAVIGTRGLRWAFEEMYDDEERVAWNLVNGKRVDDQETDLRLPPEVHRAIAAAQLGLSRSATDIGTLDRRTGPVMRAAFWRSGQTRLLPTSSDDGTFGLAQQRDDGSWRVSEIGDELWEALALAPLRLIARAAPREELEEALPLSQSMLPAHGFAASDFVVASGVPRQIQWMRRWYGDHWWKKRTP